MDWFGGGMAVMDVLGERWLTLSRGQRTPENKNGMIKEMMGS